MRRACPTSESLHRRLNTYSVAATAAGVGMLALARPVQAEIVYTPADIVLSRFDQTDYFIDLNHDGKRDFYLYANWEREGFSGGLSRIYVVAAKGNAVAGFRGAASVIAGGQVVDPGLTFAGRQMAWLDTYFGSGLGSGGNWINITNGYLGFEFKINGEKHYGWARISMSYNDIPLKATLTGYAYETEANKPITAGKTSGTEASELTRADVRNAGRNFASATLGELAAGQSLSVSRRGLQ